MAAKAKKRKSVGAKGVDGKPFVYTTKGKCLHCERTRLLRTDTGWCKGCTRSAYINEFQKQKKDKDIAAGKRPPKRKYVRKSQKTAAGSPEATKTAAEPEKVAPPLHPADEIAAKPVSKPLSSYEKGKLTVEEAIEIEQARRELARRHMIHYVLRRDPRYKAGWFHHEVCHELEAFSDQVANELSPRLLMFAPPRHGKSRLGSIDFPSFHLGRNPWHEYIAVSYSAPLAYKFSRSVQDIVSSPDYELIFPDAKLRDDMTSVEEWGLTKGGVYTAAGVGGPISGKGAHVLSLDDIIKNREDADSSLYRQMVQDWYTSTAYTRLMPGGGVLGINTRWHDADLMGYLLAMMQEAEKIAQDTGEWPEDYDKWRVVEYPAIAIEDEKYRKAGEALHPERYSLKALLRIKRTLGDRDFTALYQQRPAAEDGEYFTKEMIRYYEGAGPSFKNMTCFMAGDLAISKKEFADWSVFIVAGVTENDDIYILDVARGRWDSLEILNELFRLYRQYLPTLIGIEEGQIEKAIGPFLQKRIMEEKLFRMNVEPLPPGKRDKELRARPIQGRMRQGKVWIPRGRSWTETFVNELLRFPNSVKDDQVDALAWLGQMMNSVTFRQPGPSKTESWRDRLNSYADNRSAGRNPSMGA